MPRLDSQDNIYQRTEEIQDIIEKMPTSFGLKITYLVFGIVATMLFFGSIIRYPDIMEGKLTVNTKTSPIKLISEANGRLRLNNIKSQQSVSEDQILAWIQNSTTPKEIKWLDSIIRSVDLESKNIYQIYETLPRNRPLGELTGPYADFLLALKSLSDYKKNRLIQKQISAMRDIFMQEDQSLNIIENQKRENLKSLVLTDRSFSRDSILFSKKVISPAEFDRSSLTKINANSQHDEIIKELSATKERMSGTLKSISELKIQNDEFERATLLKLMTYKNLIIDKVTDWEHKYLIRSLFNGKIQFTNFWNQNDFVKSGEPLFTLIPHFNKIEGQVILPSQGAGKVKIGQEVIIKLDNYPYMEYGSVRGLVSSISLTTNSQNTATGVVETYLVNVNLPSNLKTNYGSILEFKDGIKGTAEIITKDRTFIERFFENLKYGVNK